MYIVTEELMTNTQEIFQKETYNHLKMLSYLEKHSTLDVFEDSTRQLLSINQLYKLIDKDFHIEKPYDCLNNQQYNDSYAYFFSFCYAFCNLTNGLNVSKYENILKLTSLLTETLRIYDLQLITLMAHAGDEQFFTQNRGYAISNYYPHSRQWYRDHMAKMGTGKKVIVSDPYVSWIDVVFISQTTNLSHTQFEGLIGQDLDFTRMPKIQTNTSQYYIVDSNGNIVISDLYAGGVKVLIKIYNQSLTGFNETDWNNIIQNDENIFYVYNSVYKKNIIVLKTELSELNYFLFVVYDGSQYLSQQQEIYNRVTKILKQLQVNWVLERLNLFVCKVIWNIFPTVFVGLDSDNQLFNERFKIVGNDGYQENSLFLQEHCLVKRKKVHFHYSSFILCIYSRCTKSRLEEIQEIIKFIIILKNNFHNRYFHVDYWEYPR